MSVDEQFIVDSIARDVWMMRVLGVVRGLGLPDCWIAAGFVRNKVWDVLHGYEERTPLADVDVIYFDASNTDEGQEKIIEHQLRIIDSAVPWSVKNMARMHLVNGDDEQYSSSGDAMKHWPETATAVGVRINDVDELELLAPYGIADLVSLRVVMSPGFNRSRQLFLNRVVKKDWQKIWPKLTVLG